MFTANQLRVHLSVIEALLKEFNEQKILPNELEISDAITTISLIAKDELALKLLAACLDNIPREDMEAAEVASTEAKNQAKVKALEAAAQVTARLVEVAAETTAAAVAEAAAAAAAVVAEAVTEAAKVVAAKAADAV